MQMKCFPSLHIKSSHSGHVRTIHPFILSIIKMMNFSTVPVSRKIIKYTWLNIPIIYTYTWCAIWWVIINVYTFTAAPNRTRDINFLFILQRQKEYLLGKKVGGGEAEMTLWLRIQTDSTFHVTRLLWGLHYVGEWLSAYAKQSHLSIFIVRSYFLIGSGSH